MNSVKVYSLAPLHCFRILLLFRFIIYIAWDCAVTDTSAQFPSLPILSIQRNILYFADEAILYIHISYRHSLYHINHLLYPGGGGARHVVVVVFPCRS